MKNKKANSYVVIGVTVIILLLIGGVFLLSKLRVIDAESQKQEAQNPKILENQTLENETLEEIQEELGCEEDIDCEDGNKCTLEACAGGVCITSEVLLCYNNDGCCPEGCHSGNDNDCLSIILKE